jgi:hypothetical protein
MEDHELEPVEILRGHVSEDTAYLVNDYPYGYTLRCKIRYWLHTADKGAYRDQMRLMSQTTNPKMKGQVWNKPKASTYAPWAVMYLDSRGYASWWPVTSHHGPRPVEFLEMRLRSLYFQLRDEELARYNDLMERSRKSSPEDWQRTVTALKVIGTMTSPKDLQAEHNIWLDERAWEIVSAANRVGLTL